MFHLGCFERKPKKDARNTIDIKWVVKWKLVSGVRSITARMTVRGFKDKDALETYAGTASRSDQRLVDAITTMDSDWVCFSIDVSKAFAKGMTFSEIANETGEPQRKVEFQLSGEDLEILKTLEGFKDYDPSREVLAMEKPIYGLKDAPRAWRRKLDRILQSWDAGGACGPLKPLKAAPEIYVAHKTAKQHVTRTLPSREAAVHQTPNAIEQAVLAEAIQSEQPLGDRARAAASDQERVWNDTLLLKPIMVLSTHVDDLKGGAKRQFAEHLLQHLETCVGKCKSEWSKFTHTGVQHEHTPGHHWAHQAAYVEQLRPIDASKLKGRSESEMATGDLHSDYMSLLGGIAWTVLTRAEAAVYVQALQRSAHRPTIGHCRRLNLVLRYIRRQQSGLRYRRLRHPVKIVGFSDAAFRAQPEESSGLALRGLATLLMESDQPGPSSKNGVVNLVDFLVRRIRRVVRSTFSAELNALIDSLENLLLLQLALHEVFCGVSDDVGDLVRRLENGQLYPPIEICTDALSVWEAIAAEDCCTPQENSLKLHLLSIRDRLARGVLKTLHWTDTRDMVGDGLTKGGVARDLLLSVSRDGQYRMQHASKQYCPQKKKYNPIDSDQNSPYAHPKLQRHRDEDSSHREHRRHRDESSFRHGQRHCECKRRRSEDSSHHERRYRDRDADDSPRDVTARASKSPFSARPADSFVAMLEQRRRDRARSAAPASSTSRGENNDGTKPGSASVFDPPKNFRVGLDSRNSSTEESGVPARSPLGSVSVFDPPRVKKESGVPARSPLGSASVFDPPWVKKESGVPARSSLGSASALDQPRVEEETGVPARSPSSHTPARCAQAVVPGPVLQSGAIPAYGAMWPSAGNTASWKKFLMNAMADYAQDRSGLDQTLAEHTGREPELYHAFLEKHYIRTKPAEEVARLRGLGICNFCEFPGHRRAECPNWRPRPCDHCGSVAHQTAFHEKYAKKRPAAASQSLPEQKRLRA